MTWCHGFSYCFELLSLLFVRVQTSVRSEIVGAEILAVLIQFIVRFLLHVNATVNILFSSILLLDK